MRGWWLWWWWGWIEMESIEPSHWKEMKEELKIGKQIIYLPFNPINNANTFSILRNSSSYLSIIPSLVWPLKDKRKSEWERNETTVLTHTLRDIEHNDDHLKLEHYNWAYHSLLPLHLLLLLMPLMMMILIVVILKKGIAKTMMVTKKVLSISFFLSIILFHSQAQKNSTLIYKSFFQSPQRSSSNAVISVSIKRHKPLFVWLVGWLIDWLVGWLVDWLVD